MREYKQAADRNKQIQILAELNDCGKDEIMDILKRNGAIPGMPSTRIVAKPVSSKIIWTAEMDAEVSRLSREGLKLNEIAERLGIPVQSIYSRRKYLSSVPGEKKPKAVPSESKTQVPKTKTVKSDKSVFETIIDLLRQNGCEVHICNVDVLNKTFSIMGGKAEV